MAAFLSIRRFAAMFAIDLILSAALAYYSTRTTNFAFPITPEAMTTLAPRIRMIRAVGSGIALLVMLLGKFGSSRAACVALALGWLLGITTSVTFLHGAGLVGPRAQLDGGIITTSALQLILAPFAIALLYGDDATDWFDRRR